MSSLKIIETNDGSHSLLNEEMNETYHSTHGAVQESVHVYIKNGLHFWLTENKKDEVSILEVGFGTGLNALLALKESLEQKISIQYATIEAFPLALELVSGLNYPLQVRLPAAENFFLQLHSAAWNKVLAITSRFSFEKREGEIQAMNLGAAAHDVVFFDAFAPTKQPELWEPPVLEKVVRSLKPGGVFVTYCAQGRFKRNLKALGLFVESLEGSPGKREMVRGSKLSTTG